MMPDSHQSARLYGAAKTHKVENYNDITLENIKLRPIMDQSGTMVYNASQVIAEYLTPLGNNDCVIKDTFSSPSILNENKIKPDEEDLSYDVEQVFTNVPIYETITYQIYTYKQVKPICSKTVMKRLLKKFVCLTFNNKLYKQINGCAMGNPLSVILANIFMAKLERDVVNPAKLILYKRYVDDVFLRTKLNT